MVDNKGFDDKTNKWKESIGNAKFAGATDEAKLKVSWLIDTRLKNEVINTVSPDHLTRMDFYTAAARQIGSAIPEFIEERQRWKIVSSIYGTYRYQVGL